MNLIKQTLLPIFYAIISAVLLAGCGGDSNTEAIDDTVYENDYNYIQTPDTIILTDYSLEFENDVNTRVVLSSLNDAKHRCEAMSNGGYDDWRLPTYSELNASIKDVLSLVMNSKPKYQRSVDKDLFFNVLQHQHYDYLWTYQHLTGRHYGPFSNTSGQLAFYAISYDFRTKDEVVYDKIEDKFDPYALRTSVCVRENHTYDDAGKGEVFKGFERDFSTTVRVLDGYSEISEFGMGAHHTEANLWMTYTDAVSYCEDLEVGGFSDWELINNKEYLALTLLHTSMNEVTNAYSLFGDNPGSYSTGLEGIHYSKQVWVKPSEETDSIKGYVQARTVYLGTLSLQYYLPIESDYFAVPACVRGTKEP
jgi:hypothetical protein